MRDLIHRLGCFVQLGVSLGLAAALHHGLGVTWLVAGLASLPLGMVATYAFMVAAGALLDRTD